MYAKKIAPPKARWVKARTRVHLVIDGKGTNIDGPIYRPGHDLQHVQEIQDFIERACNEHELLDRVASAAKSLQRFEAGEKQHAPNIGLERASRTLQLADALEALAVKRGEASRG